jgi:hypothetical protein
MCKGRRDVMDEVERLRDKYPSNSKSDREKQQATKFEKVVAGKVVKKKQGLTKKISDLFVAENIRSVFGYVFHEIMVPAARDLLRDMIHGAADRSLGYEDRRYGASRFRNDREFDRRPRVSYNDPVDSRDRHRRYELSKSSRAGHNFAEIEFETKGDAEKVLDIMADQVAEYGMATVAHFYSLAGFEPAYTDDKWGWESLKYARTVRVSGGRYIIDLPRPIVLD